MSQVDSILKMLKKDWVSPIDALKYAGAFRLGARIADIKELGYDLEEKWVTDPDTGKRWKSFRVKPPIKREALF